MMGADYPLPFSVKKIVVNWIFSWYTKQKYVVPTVRP